MHSQRNNILTAMVQSVTCELLRTRDIIRPSSSPQVGFEIVRTIVAGRL